MATIQANFRMYGVAGGYGYLGHRKGRFPSSNDIASGSTFYNEHGNLLENDQYEKKRDRCYIRCICPYRLGDIRVRVKINY